MKSSKKLKNPWDYFGRKNPRDCFGTGKSAKPFLVHLNLQLAAAGPVAEIRHVDEKCRL